MVPLSFSWDTEKGRICFRWDGIGSLEWKEGIGGLKIFGFPIPIRINIEKVSNFRVPIRWKYVKGTVSLLKSLNIHRIETAISLPDPMINGILYGGWAIFQNKVKEKRIYATVNFLGQNWWKGEVSLPLKAGLAHFKKWILPMLLEIRRKGKKKGGVRNGSNRTY